MFQRECYPRSTQALYHCYLRVGCGVVPHVNTNMRILAPITGNIGTLPFLWCAKGTYQPCRRRKSPADVDDLQTGVWWVARPMKGVWVLFHCGRIPCTLYVCCPVGPRLSRVQSRCGSSDSRAMMNWAWLWRHACRQGPHLIIPQLLVQRCCSKDPVKCPQVAAC